ncbi:hypothetical protein B566_EDAN015774 [Ephemera danica]|nr:hypothetical protein B566_EDAN015774 [Ephemera danica]
MEPKEMKPEAPMPEAKVESKDESKENEDKVGEQAQPRKMKREDFRKYLEFHGITEILTKGLTNLYLEPEVPRDPMEYPFMKHNIYILIVFVGFSIQLI